MKNKIKLLLCSLVSLLFLVPVVVSANGSPKMNFSYYAVQPSTQLDYDRDFFYVQTKPGENQTLEIELTNTSDEEISVTAIVTDAISTETGDIGYGVPLIKNETLINPISEIVVPEEKTVVLKGFEKRMISLNLTPPANHYEGVKIGAVTLTTEGDQKVDGMVKVESGYRIAIVTSENGDDFNSGSSLDLIDVKPTLVDGRKVVQAAIQNPEPQSVEGVEIESELINKKTKEVVKKSKVSGYSFAPNSTLPFIFDWGLSNLEAGEYTVTMKAKNHEHEWDMKKDFTITANQAKKINDDSPFRIVTPLWTKITAITLGVATVIIGVVLTLRNKKWQTEVLKSKKRRNRNKRREKK